MLLLLDIFLFATGQATLLSIVLTIALSGYGLVGLARKALRQTHLIWRLRNRLFVTYMFIGAVPILLIVALFLVWAFLAGHKHKWVLELRGHLRRFVQRRQDRNRISPLLLGESTGRRILRCFRKAPATFFFVRFAAMMPS